MKELAIGFAKWLKNLDNGDTHFHYYTGELTQSIGFSPSDCFDDNLKTVEELFDLYLETLKKEPIKKKRVGWLPVRGSIIAVTKLGGKTTTIELNTPYKVLQCCEAGGYNGFKYRIKIQVAKGKAKAIFLPRDEFIII